MSEAIISKKRINKTVLVPTLKTEIITSNTNWTVPNHVGNISVMVYGAGSGSTIRTATAASSPGYIPETWFAGTYGGCGGFMNNGDFNIDEGEQVRITIGRGGVGGWFNSSGLSNSGGGSGGTTSFGAYLSANGASQLAGGSTSSYNNAVAYQFGGGAGIDGGTYGGGGGCLNTSHAIYGSFFPSAYMVGNGGTYGGGGGGTYWYEDYNDYGTEGGDGGTYGGGGSGWGRSTSSRHYHSSMGGTYGGNGGTISLNTEYYVSSQSGTSGSGWINGHKSNEYKSGSRYNAGSRTNFLVNSSSGSAGTVYCSGGGGGYGGNGGSGCVSVVMVGGSRTINAVLAFGGGGGGYLSNGGSANNSILRGNIYIITI